MFEIDINEREDALKNVQGELCLIGNILRNLELLEQYKNIVTEEDFADKGMKLLYLFLQDYYATFGKELNCNKVMLFYSEYSARNKDFSQLFPVKNLESSLNKLSSLGVAGASADSPAFNLVKKYSILRALQAQGIDVKPVLARNDFHSLTAKDIADIFQHKLDDMSAKLDARSAHNIGSDLVARAKLLLEVPERGLQTPFQFINQHLHGLCKNDLTMIGGLSNSGKGRFLISLLVHLVCVEGQSVYLMSNEMSRDDYEKALICTIVNMPSVQVLHGHKLDIDQATITQNLFTDSDGVLLERNPDEETEAFFSRMCSECSEYAEYIDVVKWYQDNFAGKMHFISLMDDYSPERIRQEIKRAERLGCTIIAYDTLKAFQSTEWGDFVLAATVLSEAVKSSSTGIHGIATFQLTDNVHACPLEELDSTKIAVGKHAIHVADNLLMFKHLKDCDRRKYNLVINDLSVDLTQSLQEIKLTCFRIVKNRRGGGKDDLFALQINLDRNRWVQIGEFEKR